jgi:hypothetical protein
LTTSRPNRPNHQARGEERAAIAEALAAWTNVWDTTAAGSATRPSPVLPLVGAGVKEAWHERERRGMPQALGERKASSNGEPSRVGVWAAALGLAAQGGGLAV